MRILGSLYTVFLSSTNKKWLEEKRVYFPALNIQTVQKYSDMIRSEWPGFDSRQGKEIILYSTAFKQALETPASYRMGTGCSFPRGKVVEV
jgi:hypothetical protein